MASDLQIFKRMLDRQIASKHPRMGWPAIKYTIDENPTDSDGSPQDEIHVLVEETGWVFDKKTGKLIGMYNWQG